MDLGYAVAIWSAERLGYDVVLRHAAAAFGLFSSV